MISVQQFPIPPLYICPMIRKVLPGHDLRGKKDHEFLRVEAGQSRSSCVASTRLQFLDVSERLFVRRKFLFVLLYDKDGRDKDPTHQAGHLLAHLMVSSNVGRFLFS